MEYLIYDGRGRAGTAGDGRGRSGTVRDGRGRGDGDSPRLRPLINRREGGGARSGACPGHQVNSGGITTRLASESSAIDAGHHRYTDVRRKLNAPAHIRCSAANQRLRFTRPLQPILICRPPACRRWSPGAGLRAPASGRRPPGAGLRALISGRRPPGAGLGATAEEAVDTEGGGPIVRVIR